MPSGASRGRWATAGLFAVGIAAVATVSFFLRANAAPAVPKHVVTVVFYCCSNGEPDLPPNAPPSKLAKYTDWMFMTHITYADSLAAAGMKILQYSDPNRVGPKEATFVDDDSMYAHDCSGQRISVTQPPRMRDHFLTDPASQLTQRRWKMRINDLRKHGHIDAIFDDDAAELAALSAKPCGMNKEHWTDRVKQLIAVSPVPVIFNGLMDLNWRGGDEYAMAPTTRLVGLPNVIGGLFESCYSNWRRPNLKTFGGFWRRTEDTEMYMAHAGKLFICNENARVSGPRKEMAARMIDARQFAEASFLLSYDAATSGVRQQLQNPSAFELQPETELVAVDPLVAEPNSIEILRTNTGAYGREFASCYIMGSPVGPCAAAVNPDLNSTVRFPYSKYRHTLAMHGGGILDGGTITTDGPASADIGPQTGVVAFR